MKITTNLNKVCQCGKNLLAEKMPVIHDGKVMCNRCYKLKKLGDLNAKKSKNKTKGKNC